MTGNSKKDCHNFRTLAVLNWCLSVIGLGCNLRSENNSRPFWSIAQNVFRISIFAVIDVFSLHYKLKYLYGDLSLSIKYTDIVQMVYDFTQYIVDVHYVRKYGTVVSYQYFKQYKTIDDILTVVNYSAIRMKVLRLMAFFAFLWTTTTVCDYAAWILSYGWVDSAVYTMSYVFLLIKILTTIDMTSQVMHVECRLCAVADQIQKYYDATETFSDLYQRNFSGKKWFYKEITVETPSNTRRNVTSIEIIWLSRCYLLLTDQVAFINKMYGIRILLNSLSLLIDMVRFTNIAARILTGSQKTKYYSGYFPAISTIMRLMTCASVLISLAWHCEQLYKQRLRILNIIDHLLIYKNPSEEKKKAVTELRNLIQMRPIDVSMASFFRVDYSLLVSIASVVVTYSIILLQSIN